MDLLIIILLCICLPLAICGLVDPDDRPGR